MGGGATVYMFHLVLSILHSFSASWSVVGLYVKHPLPELEVSQRRAEYSRVVLGPQLRFFKRWVVRSMEKPHWTNANHKNDWSIWQNHTDFEASSHLRNPERTAHVQIHNSLLATHRVNRQEKPITKNSNSTHQFDFDLILFQEHWSLQNRHYFQVDCVTKIEHIPDHRSFDHLKALKDSGVWDKKIVMS